GGVLAHCRLVPEGRLPSCSPWILHINWPASSRARRTPMLSSRLLACFRIFQLLMDGGRGPLVPDLSHWRNRLRVSLTQRCHLLKCLIQNCPLPFDVLLQSRLSGR